ncbi:right-handed parallel beta-helix repeat-containing protein [Rubripirellula amarantea]|nr:right-handed parallel beta-helix repeat-containing protein [Rubripirellula amarantea]
MSAANMFNRRFGFLRTCLGPVAAVAIAGLAQSQNLELSQSYADRTLSDGQHEDYIARVGVDAVSPAWPVHDDDDVVIRSALVKPAETITVVRRPPVSQIGKSEFPGPSETQSGELDPDYNLTREIQQWFQMASEGNLRNICLPANRNYHLRPKQPGGRHLLIEGLRDCVVDLNGSTLFFSSVGPGLVLKDCQRVLIRGGEIQGASTLATIAQVVKNHNGSGRSLKVLPEFVNALQADFPDGKVPLWTIAAIQKQTGSSPGWRLSQPVYQDWFVNRRTRQWVFDAETQSFVPTKFHSVDASLLLDDYVMLVHHNNEGHAIMLDNRDGQGLEDITFEDMTFRNIPGMMIAGELNRGLHLRRVQTQLRSNSSPGLLSVASDTVHINSVRGDIIIEDCSFNASFDDKINIKSNYWRIAEVAGNEVTVHPAGRPVSVKSWGKKNDRILVVGDDLEEISQSRLVVDSERLKGKQHLLRLDKFDASLKAGQLIFNADTAGGRVVIQNNRFLSTRAQGVLVQTSHVLIRGNIFDEIAGPAISVRFGLSDWYESIAPSNIVIEQNRFGAVGFDRDKANAAIEIKQKGSGGSPVSIISNVRIRDNELLSPPVDGQ